MGAKARTLGIVIIAFVLAAPAVAAAPWTLYHAGLDRSAGETREPDGAVVAGTGAEFDGVANRVTRPGAAPGDGALFLDARMGAGTSDANAPVLYAGRAAANEGRGDILLPGSFAILAWYGTWNDLDADGVIADLHDAACPSGCAGDEFKWRGSATGETLVMANYVLPNDALLLHGSGGTPGAREVLMRDRTSFEEPEQAWVGGDWFTADGGLLVTMQTVTVAGAKPGVAGAYTVDVRDPDALVDVDRYESVNADVESLYKSVYGITGDPIVDIWDPARDEVFGAIEPVEEALGDPVGTVFRLPAKSPKEPNHVDDDYEGRATFGGTGDHLGSFNTYPDYADSYHLYVDTMARGRHCIGAYAEAPGTGIAATVDVLCPETRLEPVSILAHESQSASSLLNFEAMTYLWHDANGDTHIGEICDPHDPESFDTDRNTCRSAESWPHDPFALEKIDACEFIRGKGTTFTVTPIGGPWPAVVVLRDWAHATRVAYSPPGHWEVRTDSAPITLRWELVCGNTGLESRDALLFTSGFSSIAVRVDSDFSIAAYRDYARGIDIENERVRDVDVLPASL